MRAVNLIPAEQREGAGGITGRSGGAALIVLALVAGLAVLAVVYGSAKRSESKSRAELTTVNAELASAKAQVGRLAPYTSFISMAEQRTQAVKQLVASRFDWSHAFNELGRVLPNDASLTGLQGQVGGSATGAAPPPASTTATAAASAGSAPTSATPPGSTPTFTITGCATSQSEVAQTLQRLRLIDGVSDVTLQSSVKSASGGTSGSGAGSGSSSNCGSNGAAFSVTVTFTALPSAPAANATPTAPGTGAAGAQSGASSGNQAVAVSSSQAGAK